VVPESPLENVAAPILFQLHLQRNAPADWLHQLRQGITALPNQEMQVICHDNVSQQLGIRTKLC
jgi:hypothetical protein